MFPLCRWENWGWERLNNFDEVNNCLIFTQLSHSYTGERKVLSETLSKFSLRWISGGKKSDAAVFTLGPNLCTRVCHKGGGFITWVQKQGSQDSRLIAFPNYTNIPHRCQGISHSALISPHTFMLEIKTVMFFRSLFFFLFAFRIQNRCLHHLAE